MPQDLAWALKQTIEREAVQLRAVAENDAGTKPSPDKWSQKEELGHLIDSATNNHVRFVRASLEPEFRGPGYEQNDWINLHGYNEMSWADLIGFWQHYNTFLSRLVGRIPKELLERRCIVGNSAAVTLRFLIEDYILHMQHHLDHILRRERTTEYPGAAIGV